MQKRWIKKMILMTAAALMGLMLTLSGTLPAFAAEDSGDDPGDLLYYKGGLMAAEALAEEDGETTRGEAQAYEAPLSGSGLTHDSRFSDTTRTIGIDVSFYQGTINWSKVKAAGVKFAIIRCGYSTLAKGEKNQDVKFLEYIKAAHAAGIKVGVYYFSQAISVKEAVAEAEFAAGIIKSSGITPDLPVFMDVEIVSNSIYSRMISAKLSKEAETTICRAFCKTMEDKGYRAGVYSSTSYYNTRMNAAELAKDYIIWLAHYTNKTTYTGDYTFWQHGSTGTVNGISGRVDCNIWYDCGTFAVNSSTDKAALSSTNSTLGSSAVSAVKTGWVEEDGKIYYVDPATCEKVMGMQKIDGKYYYFSKVSAKKMTGWRTIDGSKYYFNKADNGVRASGLLKIKKKTYYFDPATGIMQTGFVTAGGKTYYFDAAGVMQTGWKTIGSARYRFASDGTLYTYQGWKTLSGKTYYFGSDHGALRGWQTIGGNKYYFGGNGVMRTGWKTISSGKYYFGKNGIMRTGLRKIGKYRYYFGESGIMQTRWHTIGSYRYYFNSKNGHALTGTKVLGGKTYVFDSKGRLT